MTRKRVVITGLSAISPLGNNVADSWNNLLAGKSGIGPITHFDASAFDSRIAGEVKNFVPEEFDIPPKQARRMDRFVQFAVAGAHALLPHAGFTITEENAESVAVLLGVGLGGLKTIEDFHSKLVEAGPGKISPFMIPMLISNMAPGQVSIMEGCKGPNLVVTSACASALHAIGYAFSEILLGRIERAITGGVEATITPMGVSGFTALRALSTSNDNPETASRPFDKDRNGFVMGEGAGMLFIESLESAKQRGATIYAELVGFGASGDAYHMTAPKEDGAGMAAAMRRAIQDAGLKPEDIDHINAHGTSTSLNDLCETRAIKTVFGERAYKIPITANKSQMGHLLGAAGGIESVISALTLHHGIIPGTANYTTPDPECDLDYVAEGPRKQQVQHILCNSFGFGGTNCCLVFKRWAE
ncbi:beta-ketoacyl-ACP synthase II [Desulfovibrio cuneatus]|uniref:beta-ketoacyl-ACP synthase II n=1 Tax=Desulfovibrio cuneatus TaxID=159728 RepID=UPI000401290B|nr:beta-ketoacyl-ACP synthase II [Desulfovibrio cuneatus]